MCWSAWHIYQSGHDRAWLARVYPGLAGYVKFWVKYHSSSRGLVQFFNAGQIGDNDARFDRVYNRDNGESTETSRFLVLNRQISTHFWW